MLILNLGVPRSGTVMVFNIFREILTRKNVSFRHVNTNLRDTDRFLASFDYGENVLMHSHSMSSLVQQALHDSRTFGFFNYRDPRDVLVSLMKLHEHEFDHTLDFVTKSFKGFQDAVKLRQRVMFVPYEHLIVAPDVFIFQLAHRLGIFLDLVTIAAVREATSREAHQKVMSEVREEAIDVRHVRGAGRPVVESTKHLINDRHMQSGESGRWRQELSPAQQKKANERFEPILRRLGYSAA